MSHPAEQRRGMPLHTKILLGLAIGAVAGVVSNIYWADEPWLGWTVDNVAQPVGQIFLRMLFMVVVPLIFTSITLGVASLGDIKRVGRIGAKTIGFFLVTTAFAATIGLTMVNVMKPGETLDPATRDQLMEEYSTDAAGRATLAEEGGFGINTFVSIVPRNPVEAAASGQMLSLIFFSIVFGIALTQVARERAEPVMRVLEGISEAVMIIIGFAMKLAPVGVAGLIFAVTARFGLGVLKSLAVYVVMVLIGLAIQQFAVIPTLARVLAGISPATFFRRAWAMMVTAFSTSSSNATLPTTIRTAQENFGVPPSIAGFVLPLGATMNMNGTALFEGMTVLFLAQVFGVDLSLTQQLLVIGMSVITAVGAAGVPGGSIPLLVLVLEMVGVPGMAIALVLGVDRILDMSRTVPNVTGDLLTSLVVTKSEGLAFEIPEVPVSATGEPVPAADAEAVA